jgi:chromate reductase
MRVLAISGSLRDASNNTRLLRAAAEETPQGVELVLWAGLKEIPPYDQDDDVVRGPAVVEALRDAVREADAVMFATPEYNSSVPGALKNALDWASRPVATNAFRNKPVGVVGSSAGMFGAVWAQAELRKVLGAMGARVADIEVAVGHSMDKFDDEGVLVDDATREQIREAVEVLVATASAELVAA